jgi:hypothetical protein
VLEVLFLVCRRDVAERGGQVRVPPSPCSDLLCAVTIDTDTFPRSHCRCGDG